jgi:hypothetical protein
MKRETLIAGIGAFVLALAVIAVVSAVFARGGPGATGKSPVGSGIGAGVPGGEGRPIVDIDWKSSKGSTGEASKKPAQVKKAEPAGAGTGQETD